MSGTAGSLPPTLAAYLAHIAPEHANKPNFVAMVTTMLQPLLDGQALLRELLLDFDLDTAVGVQLDAVGVRVGRSRYVNEPLAGVYFSFDIQGLGFDQGVWYYPFNPTSGVVALGDDVYRALLKAKVIMNGGDGTIATMGDAVNEMLTVSPGSTVSIQDNQNMTMNVNIGGTAPPPVVMALLQGGYVPVQPEGVAVNYTAANVTGVTPGQITALSVASLQPTSVQLAWQAPATGTGPFNYQMRYQAGNGSGAWTNYGAATTSTVGTVSGLTPGTQYAFDVYAFNLIGSGAPSAPLVLTTPTQGETIVINTITATAGQPFTVSGTLVGYSAAPVIYYTDDNTLPTVTGVTETASQNSMTLNWSAVSPNILPAGATTTQSGFSFTHPAMASGSHTLTLEADVGIASITYDVT